MESKNRNESVSTSSSIDINPVLCCKSKSGPIQKTKKKVRFTIKQKISLLMLALADFMCYCSMSLMSPFYPAECARKGVPDSISGLVFGAYAGVIFITSPIFGKILPRFGAKKIFIGGLLLSGTASLLFGPVGEIEDYTWFVVSSFGIRGFEALGASAYSTAGYVLIMNIFPDHTGSVRGLLETFVGLGLSAGPGLGGILYAVGGFGLPFYVAGSFTLLIAFLNMYLLTQPEKNEVEKSGSLRNLLKLPPVLMTCFIMVVASMNASYLDPTLEPHLRKFDLSSTQVGLLFLLLSATYGIFSPIWGWITDKTVNYTWMLTTGLFCSSVVLLFLGPSPVFTFLEDSILLNALALLALGVFTAMAIIPTYQYILDCAMENGHQDTLGTQSVIAGLWSSVYSLGEVIGPVLGGALMEKFEFPITSSTFALFNFIGAVIALVYFKVKNMRSKRVSKKASADNICYVENGSDPTTSVQNDNRIEENVTRL